MNKDICTFCIHKSFCSLGYNVWKKCCLVNMHLNRESEKYFNNTDNQDREFDSHLFHPVGIYQVLYCTIIYYMTCNVLYMTMFKFTVIRSTSSSRQRPNKVAQNSSSKMFETIFKQL